MCETKVKEGMARTFLPYGRQHISQEDIDAVAKVLRSDWLTQGPTIAQLEEALCKTTGAGHFVACATGTAALHLTMLALGIGPGDTVVTTPITFLSDANCVRFVGADVAFVDVDPETANMSPESLAETLKRDKEKNIKAVIPVHLAGQPADLPRIHRMTVEHGAVVVDDACHALGASYDYEEKTCMLGNSPHSVMTAYSFHPVKHVAMGEGGAVATNDASLAERLRQYRNHGMVKQSFQQPEMAYSSPDQVNPWYYEMSEIGFNYRITDIQAALGISQLSRLNWSIQKRREIAQYYSDLLGGRFTRDEVRSMGVRPGVRHAYHLFIVRIDFKGLGVSRATVMERLRAANIGTQVHYIPVHLQPYYRRHAGTGPGDLPNAETYYEQALSLPMYPQLTQADCERVVAELAKAIHKKG